MLVPDQLIEVKVIGVTLKHYRDLGYDVSFGDTIYVPPEHLTDGSKSIVQIKCDICGASNIFRPYKAYLKYHTYNYDACDKCKELKKKRTCIEKYGADSPMKIKMFKEKQKNALIENYGVDNPSKSEIIQNKKIETFQNKYGTNSALQCVKVREKIKNTMLDKYGCENPMQNDEIKQKAKQTNLIKYGVANPTQSPMILEKVIQTMSNNGRVPTSSQQIAIYEMVKNKYPTAEINYPFSICSLDVYVCINDIPIDIEYDCWYWHQDKQKDIKRDKFLQSQGFKTLRIRSGHLLPTEEELFDAIDYLVNTEHHFKEIILSDWKEGEVCQEQLLAV